MTFHYFGFGSNMLTERLTARCPGAIAVGRASADRRVIEFSKRSRDGSGKATLRHAVDGKTEGVLFEIPESERECLDHHEGCGYGYRRHDAFLVRPANTDETVPVVTYLATSTDSSLELCD